MDHAGLLKRFSGKKIAVLMGGMSSEREISLRSGNNVFNALKKLGLDAVPIDVTPKIYNDLEKEKPDVAFIVLHGKFGEDGCVQGLLEIMNIPYTGSGVLGSSIGMNKVITKRILSDNDIPVPADVSIDWSDLDTCLKKIEDEIGYPAVLKPVSEGSSIGVQLIKDAPALRKALGNYREQYPQAFVEQYVRGRELTVGLIGKGDSVTVLPIMALEPKSEFYDFEAKYTKGKTDFEIPARMSKETEELVRFYSIKAFNELHLGGVARVDVILDAEENPYFLEANTIPGMTDTSDIPAMAKAAGMSYEDIVATILDCVNIGTEK